MEPPPERVMRTDHILRSNGTVRSVTGSNRCCPAKEEGGSQKWVQAKCGGMHWCILMLVIMTVIHPHGHPFADTEHRYSPALLWLLSRRRRRWWRWFGGCRDPSVWGQDGHNVWQSLPGKTLESPLHCREIKESILKEINPEHSLERQMSKLQYFGLLMERADSLEKTLMLGKIEGKRRKGR